ncbi:MAG TPA: nucleotidyltransferase family protein, partial [Candidatus Dormibacteraeota bacterium]|nr:nucleotidyltransferase family protein [Candidatus Dormibacteraeota bacterium]
MASIPDFLMGALQFRDPRREVLRKVKDSEWEVVLTSWQTARLTLLLRQQCGDNLPDWVRSRIDAYLSDNALRFERIKAVYSTIAKAFQNEKADHVVIKGFSLWPGYSEHPRFRPQSDIDL